MEMIAKIVKACENDLSLLTGQKPVLQNLKNQYQILKQEKVQMQD